MQTESFDKIPKVFKHNWIGKNPKYLIAYWYMISNTHIKRGKEDYNNKGVLYEVERNQLLISDRKLEKLSGGFISRQEARTFFKKLEADEIIRMDSIPKVATKITWLRYGVDFGSITHTNTCNTESYKEVQPTPNEIDENTPATHTNTCNTESYKEVQPTGNPHNNPHNYTDNEVIIEKCNPHSNPLLDNTKYLLNENIDRIENSNNKKDLEVSNKKEPISFSGKQPAPKAQPKRRKVAARNLTKCNNEAVERIYKAYPARDLDGKYTNRRTKNKSLIEALLFAYPESVILEVMKDYITTSQNGGQWLIQQKTFLENFSDYKEAYDENNANQNKTLRNDRQQKINKGQELINLLGNRQ